MATNSTPDCAGGPRSAREPGGGPHTVMAQLQQVAAERAGRAERLGDAPAGDEPLVTLAIDEQPGRLDEPARAALADLLRSGRRNPTAGELLARSVPGLVPGLCRVAHYARAALAAGPGSGPTLQRPLSALDSALFGVERLCASRDAALWPGAAEMDAACRELAGKLAAARNRANRVCSRLCRRRPRRLRSADRTD